MQEQAEAAERGEDQETQVQRQLYEVFGTWDAMMWARTWSCPAVLMREVRSGSEVGADKGEEPAEEA